MELIESQKIFALNVGYLIHYIYCIGLTCTFGEAYRTAEQAEIYANEGKGIINSLHRKRLAIDLNIFSPSGELLTSIEALADIGKEWEKFNSKNRWGGNFKKRPDTDHFEMQE